MTWGHYYWSVYLVVVIVGVLIPEIYALFTNVNNTLSYWVWQELGVSTDHPTPYTALWYLSLALWISLGSWLTFHFWWRKFV